MEFSALISTPAVVSNSHRIAKFSIVFIFLLLLFYFIFFLYHSTVWRFARLRIVQLVVCAIINSWIYTHIHNIHQIDLISSMYFLASGQFGTRTKLSSVFGVCLCYVSDDVDVRVCVDALSLPLRLRMCDLCRIEHEYMHYNRCICIAVHCYRLLHISFYTKKWRQWNMVAGKH